MSMTGKLLNGWEKTESLVLLMIAISIPISIAATNIAFGLGTLLLIRRMIVSRVLTLRITKGITVLLVSYLILDLTATIFSGFPINLKSLIEDKWVIMGYFIALGLVPDKIVLNKLLTALIISSTVSAYYSIIQFVIGWDFLRGQILEPIGKGYVAVGTFSHHLTLGGLLMLGLIIVLSRILFQPNVRRKYIFLASTVVLSIGLFVSYSRSAIVGLFGGLAVLVYAGDKKLRKIVIIFSILSGLLLLILVPGTAQRFLNSFSLGEHSEGPRIRLWLTSVEIIKHHPLFGIGQGNFDIGFEKYHIVGKYHNHAHPHNDFLSVAVDGGLISLSVFLLMWAVYIIKMNRLIIKPKDVSNIWIPVMGLSAVVSLLIAGNFQNYQSDAEVGNMLWFIVGLTMAYEYLTNKQEQK